MSSSPSSSSVNSETDQIVYIRFVLPSDDLLPPDIEDARLRLTVRRRNSPRSGHHHHPRHRHPHHSNLAHISVHQVVDAEEQDNGHLALLSRRSVFLSHSDASHTDHQYIDLDVTDAVSAWLLDPTSNLGLQLKCEHCEEHQLHIVHQDDHASDEESSNAELIAPELFVVGRTDPDANNNNVKRLKRSRQHRHYQASGAGNHRGGSHRGGRVARRTECANGNKRCCRHRLDVVFKEVQGFEFIMQPLSFDAGYCHGRCPPRYNPAHHHAFLQSMIWQQSPERVSRPCCAPSKLEPLEVLHADEMDATKMKVSTWLDMRVLECACS